jgi:hypothetical protein
MPSPDPDGLPLLPSIPSGRTKEPPPITGRVFTCSGGGGSVVCGERRYLLARAFVPV